MTLWYAIPRWVKAHPFTVDAFVAISIFILATVDVATLTAEGSERQPDALAYVLLVGHTLPLAFRRRYPLVVMYVVVVSLGLYWLLEYPAGADADALFAIYSAAANVGARRKMWTHVAVATSLITTLAVIALSFDEEGPPGLAIVGIVGLHGTAAILGEVVYQRRQRIADLEHRARLAEQEVEIRARQAVLDERTRIAREMHDVVAHGMSVIAVQAAAAREIVRTNPDKTMEVLATIEAVGRDSLTEMRRMLGVLRDNDDSESTFSPTPTLSEIAGLVSALGATGIDSNLVVSGVTRSLPAGVELAGFRIVQEALTNVRKHAGRSSSVVVRIDYGVDALSIEVSDDGVGATSSLSQSGGGNGLIGMRERVEIYGGEFSAGPAPGGGYVVRVVLPVTDTRPAVASAASHPSEASP